MSNNVDLDDLNIMYVWCERSVVFVCRCSSSSELCQPDEALKDQVMGLGGPYLCDA